MRVSCLSSGLDYSPTNRPSLLPQERFQNPQVAHHPSEVSTVQFGDLTAQECVNDISDGATLPAVKLGSGKSSSSGKGLPSLKCQRLEGLMPH